MITPAPQRSYPIVLKHEDDATDSPSTPNLTELANLDFQARHAWHKPVATTLGIDAAVRVSHDPFRRQTQFLEGAQPATELLRLFESDSRMFATAPNNLDHFLFEPAISRLATPSLNPTATHSPVDRETIRPFTTISPSVSPIQFDHHHSPTLPIQVSRTVSTIQRFATLEADWGGRGTAAISYRTIVHAIRFIQGMWASLPRLSRHNFAAPDVGPSSSDEIGFEWEIPGCYLSVIVDSTSEVELYWRRTIFGSGHISEQTIKPDHPNAFIDAARIYGAMFD